MTRRRLVAAAALALVVAAPVAGYAAAESQAAWRQQLCDAQTAMDANQASMGAAGVTGQDPRTLQLNYLAAATRFDQAAAHLHLDPNQLSTECTP